MDSSQTPPRHRRSKTLDKVTPTVADAWQNFYQTPAGRAAIAELLVSCNVYNALPAADAHSLAVAEGERRVALRIIGLIGFKPDNAPRQAWDDTDILDRMSRGQGY